MIAEQARRAAAARPGLKVATAMLPEETVPALLEAGREAGLLVLGSRGVGAVKGLLLGSVSQRVASRAPFPVVVVPEGAAESDRGRVVLALGARQPPGAAGEFATAEATARGAELEVVHAWEPDVDLSALSVVADAATAEQRAHALLAAATVSLELGTQGVRVVGRAMPGPAAPALLQAAAGADLLVLGVRRRHGGLGRVAHAVLHRATCPVAVVPLAADR
jgi:nucleotide-binding universal stress UspA family protein